MHIDKCCRSSYTGHVIFFSFSVTAKGETRKVSATRGQVTNPQYVKSAILNDTDTAMMAMKYMITQDVLGVKNTIEISANDFSNIQTAYATLQNVISSEEQFDAVARNFF